MCILPFRNDRRGIALGLLLFATTRLAAAPGDEHWSRHFGWPGTSNVVQALTLNGNKVYASGYYANPTVSTNLFVEVWDGYTWQYLEGLTGNAPIYDIAIVGNILYVAGFIRTAGDMPAVGLARWDGTNWSGVGGFEGVALSLATDGANLYVGGSFTNAGGVSATNIAKWNGSQWSALGDGLGYYDPSLSWFVYTLELHDGYVYAAGAFNNSGGNPVRNLARWDGIRWSEIGGGLGGPVYALAFDGSDLYVGGNFTKSGSVGIAKWDGFNWFPLGVGVNAAPNSGIPNGPVFAIGILGTNVYVGGSFTFAGGVAASYFAIWNGSSWITDGVGVSDTVNRIRVQGTNVYLGGAFVMAGPTIANHMARWDGLSFSRLNAANRSDGINPAELPVRAVAAMGRSVYAGGIFSAVGDITASRIARWDGYRWWPLGSGIQGTNTEPGTAVNAIAISSNYVYVGGSFASAGGVEANNIARWDGYRWWPLGSGIPGSVYAIATRGNELFVGGSFQFLTADGFTAFNIVRWDGAKWRWVPGTFYGATSNFFVSAIAVSGTNVYVGGSFTAGAGIKNIVRNTGLDWVGMGTGANGEVNAIAVDGNDVYIGGRFTSVSGVTASKVAKWNGSSWSALGNGVIGPSNSSVSALAVIGGNVYAGGNFTDIGDIVTTGVAKWTGTNWTSLGGGLSSSFSTTAASALAANSNNLYVGGSFEFAGDQPSYHFAHWNDPVDFSVPPTLWLSDPVYLEDGTFQFRITATGIIDYTIERTTDSTPWTPCFTNNVSPFNFIDTNVVNQTRVFYRARQ